MTDVGRQSSLGGKRPQNITVIVIETVREKDKITRYSARTLEQLRAQNPRGFELYQQYVAGEPSGPADVAKDKHA